MVDTVDGSTCDETMGELSDALPPLETVRDMIQYETRLRLSEPVQDLFDLYQGDDRAIT